MGLMWFKQGVTPMTRKCVQLDFQQYMTNQLLPFKGANVRTTLELDPVEKTLEQGTSHFHLSDEGKCQTAAGLF